MQKQIGTSKTKFTERLTIVRDWVRRVMPTVALVAAVLFILRAFFEDTFLYGNNPLGLLLSFVTSLVVSITIIYYGFKLLRWIKRKLFWRVRRRLLITYLFVGLTPIVLLSGLGFLFCYGLALNAMAGSVMAQVEATERQTLETARTLADSLAMMPSQTDDESLKTWLDERNKLLQASLPGARIAVWRGDKKSDANAKAFSEKANVTSEINDERTKSVGPDATPLETPLPEWLKDKEDWGGFAFTPPKDEKERFGSPSFRAVVRRGLGQSSLIVLLTVPVNRALVEHYRASTNLDVKPYFYVSPVAVEKNEKGIQIRIEDENSNTAKTNKNAEKDNKNVEERERSSMPIKDQFGETRSGYYAWVILRTTDWTSGENNPHIAFLFPSSFEAARSQFLERGYLGQSLNLTFVLKIFGVIFFTLEGSALLAAVLMTRAVTSMVHRLHRGTQFIMRGDFSHRIKSNSHDQLGELAFAFNEMSANVESLLQERVMRERLEKEVEIAAEVQSRLFPERVPDLLTVEIAAECRAARGVAGDYYDYVEVLPGLVALALGDVSGKGMSASLVMSNLQASLRSQAAITAERLSIAARAAAATSAGTTDRALARVMADAQIEGAISRQCSNINKQLCQSTDANRFATLFLALYEDRTRALHYTNAGHNSPILVRADGSFERLTTGGMMVGAFDFAQYEESSLTLDPNDILVVFSDGISEAESQTGEEYGEDRLLKFVIEHRSLSAHNLRDAVFKEIDTWAGGKERGDDQTILILKGRE